MSDNEPVLKQTQFNISIIPKRYTTYVQNRNSGMSSVDSDQSVIYDKLNVAVQTGIKKSTITIIQ